MSDNETVTHHRVCHLCEAMCGLVIQTEGAKVVDIRGDRADPLSRGHICPKAVALQDIHEDPDRLRKPLKRVRSAPGVYRHEEIEWDEAFDLAADAMAATIRDHGVDAVGAYFGNPSVHNYGMLTHQRNLFRHIRTRNRFSATSVDQLPHHLVSLWCFGHMLLQPIPDVDRTHYFLMLGANPLASNGSLWTVPDVRRRLKDLQARGGKLVVIDPRRTETAEMASEHHFIKPGTDATFLLAMIHVLFRDELVDPGAMKSYTDGVDGVGAAVTELTPQWAEERTGIAAADIERIAHEMAAAEAGICYGRMGSAPKPMAHCASGRYRSSMWSPGILISPAAVFLRRRQWIRWPIPVRAVSLGSRVESAVYLSLTMSCLQRRWPMKFAPPERGRSS